MRLSLIVPCYNEAENVAPFQDAVIGAFDGCGYAHFAQLFHRPNPTFFLESKPKLCYNLC